MGSQLNDKFQQLIKGLVATEKKAAEALQKQTTPKPWVNFASDDFKTKAAEKKETALKQPLDRKKANEDYLKARGDEEGQSLDTTAAKIAGDYLGAVERDKRMQWRSRIRQIAHATGLRAGNGNDAGALTVNSTGFVERMILKAESKPAEL